MFEDPHAVFYDGTSSKKHPAYVRVVTGSMALEIELENTRLTWPLDQIRGVSPTKPLVLTLVGDDNDPQKRQSARLVIHNEALADWVIRSRPNLFRRDHLKNATKKVIMFGAGAVAALMLMLFVIIPTLADSLSVLVPRERERQLGDAVVEVVISMMLDEEMFTFGEDKPPRGEEICGDSDGMAALEKMVMGLYDGGESGYDLTIRVVDHPMVNAFAAPGGFIVLTDGIIQDIDGQDALAGVIAHEIGHVDAQHSLRALLRASGSAGLLSMAIGDVGGGIAAVVLEQAITSAHSRANETEADAFAHEMLQKADVSAEPMAGFFDMIMAEYEGHDGEEHGIFGYFASHPPSKERADEARAVAATQSVTSSILSETEWQALRQICDVKYTDITLEVAAP